MVVFLMVSSELVSLDLLKVKIFWNKGYDVVIFVHVFTSKDLWREWNYIRDVAMWLKFGNSSISMKEVITSIL